jgi:hypothetical protein
MSDGSRTGTFFSSRAAFGLCVVVFGVFMTAANLGWTSVGQVWNYWPLCIAAAGVAKLMDSCSGNRWFGGVLLAIGLWWTVDNVYGLRFHFWQWWPIVLVIMGVMMVLRSREVVAPAQGAEGGSPHASGASFAGGATDTSAGTGNGDAPISAFAFWSGSRRQIMSQRFTRADVVAVMGGVELDLRQAGTATGEAVLDVFVMWGGVTVRVPPDWNIINQVVPIMGGSDDRTSGTSGARHRLRVRGVVMWGGVKIRS